MKTRLVVLLVSAFACLAFSGCGKVEFSGEAQIIKQPVKIIVQLDWVAEPEHGGFYQAQAKGFFKAAGLDVEIIPGGPNAFVMQKVATGQAQFGQGDSTNTLLAIAQDVPVIQIAAVFQNDPSVLMLHQDNPV
ncbi:MAG TPA: ABC transporter substrate-binding protein, partial [Rariglobus sp.]